MLSKGFDGASAFYVRVSAHDKVILPPPAPKVVVFCDYSSFFFHSIIYVDNVGWDLKASCVILCLFIQEW